jgi:hypothetical protein
LSALDSGVRLARDHVSVAEAGVADAAGKTSLLSGRPYMLATFAESFAFIGGSGFLLRAL